VMMAPVSAVEKLLKKTGWEREGVDHRAGEIVTGLLYIDESQPDLHGANSTIETPLNQVPYEQLCPGPESLSALQKRYR